MSDDGTPNYYELYWQERRANDTLRAENRRLTGELERNARLLEHLIDTLPERKP